jgi:hypothetical protein
MSVSKFLKKIKNHPGDGRKNKQGKFPAFFVFPF